MLPELLAVLLLAAAPPAEELSIEVEHATGLVHRGGSLVPLHVRLENQGNRPRQLVLEGGNSEQVLDQRRPVELAPGTRKEFLFYLSSDRFNQELTVRLLAEDGDLEKEVLLTSIPIYPKEVAIGLIGEQTVSWMDREILGFPAKVASLKLPLLPTTAEALSVFRVLIWPQPQPELLQPEQRRTLSDWLMAGGHLIVGMPRVGAGAAAEALAPWTSIRPLSVRAVESLPSLEAVAGYDLGPLAEPLAATLLDPGQGQTVVREAWGPLVAEERRGLGSVLAIGFDLMDTRIADWRGMPRLLGQWCRHWRVVPEDEDAHGDPFDLRRRLETFLQASSERTEFRFRTLIWALLLYLAAIGPVDYFLLRKFRRLTWTWWTYPLTVLLFAGGAWGVANRSNELQGWVKHLLWRDLPPGAERFTEELYGLLLGPRSQRYGLEPLAPGMVGRAIYDLYPMWSPRSRSFKSLIPVYEQGIAKVSARVPRWGQMKASFVGHAPRGAVAVEARLRRRQGEWSGEVTSRLDLDLEAASLLALGSEGPLVYPLGRLAAGASVVLPEVAIRFEKRHLYDNRAQGTWPAMLQILAMQSSRSILVESLDLESFGNLAYMVSPMQDPHPEKDWSTHLERGGAVLIGWGEDGEQRFDTDLPGLHSGWILYRIALPPVEEDP